MHLIEEAKENTSWYLQISNKIDNTESSMWRKIIESWCSSAHTRVPPAAAGWLADRQHNNEMPLCIALFWPCSCWGDCGAANDPVKHNNSALISSLLLLMLLLLKIILLLLLLLLLKYPVNELKCITWFFIICWYSLSSCLLLSFLSKMCSFAK